MPIAIKITLVILCLTTVLSGQDQIKLNYEPKGVLVIFSFEEDLKIYSDTSSVLEVVNSYADSSLKEQVRNLINTEVLKASDDTISFKEDFVVRGTEKGKDTYWYVKGVALQLLEENRIKIIDETGQLVSSIKIKTVKCKEKGTKFYTKWKIYMNARTGKELFKKCIEERTFTPRFF